MLSPALADLLVSPDPCPGGAASCPLADGASVFIGDTLKIVPSISPSPAITPLTDWRFDFDFHDGNANDSSPTYPRLKAPDLFYTGGQTAPPASITLVGPCDPKGAVGVDPSTGANCWASVLGNANYGGPDFTGPFTAASEGTSKTLTLALEAQNAQNPTGTSSLKRFNIAWKIPRVKLKSGSVPLGEPVEDGSEGKPAATGFRWYFASPPGVPASESAPLVEDQGCTGSICNHTFSSKGTYDYWVTVPYSTGYTSEDCGKPCIRARGQISVVDVALSFTAPSAVSKSSSTFTVTDGSTRAFSVTPCPATSSGYEYSICDAGAGACAPTSWLPISFPTPLRQASIPTPTPTSYPGTYWLRLRYSYTTTNNCGSPLQASWQPGTVAGNPDVWQFAVTNVIPTIWLKRPNGSDVCPLGLPGCPPFPLEHNATIKAYAYIGSVEDSNPPAITWDFGHAPAAGSGQGAQHTYTNSGTSGVTYYITLNGYGVPVTETVTVAPSPPTPPTITSFTFTPPAPAVGEVVTFSCPATIPEPLTITGWNWQFGDGQWAETTQGSVAHAYSARGSYTASCTVTGSNGQSAVDQTFVDVGCSDVGFVVADQATGSVISEDPLLGLVVRSGQLLTFSSPNPGPYSWDFGDGGTSTSNPTSHVFNWFGSRPDQHTVRFSSGSCARRRTVTVLAIPPVLSSFTATPSNPTVSQVVTFQCVANPGAGGAISSFSWGFGDGQTATSSQGLMTHSYASAGAFRATCKAIDASSQSTSRELLVTVGGGQAAGTKFYSVLPCRVIDTRASFGALAGPALLPGSERVFALSSTCNIPPTAASVAVNVTMTMPSQAGYLTLWPATMARPLSSTINFATGQTRANNAVIGLSPDGTGSLRVFNGSSRAVHMILDVVGYFRQP